MKDYSKPIWGQTDKIGKGTKANYDATKQILTFCFNRGPNMTSEDLRKSREKLMSDLKKLGFDSRMKYNGEVIVENVAETDVVLVTKNHKLLIHLNERQPTIEKKENNPEEKP